MSTCDNCLYWGEVQSGVGLCNFTSKHTSGGFYCPQYKNSKDGGLKPPSRASQAESGSTLYAKILKKYAAGDKISVTIVKKQFRCTWLESAAIIERLESNGLIKLK